MRLSLADEPCNFLAASKDVSKAYYLRWVLRSPPPICPKSFALHPLVVSRNRQVLSPVGVPTFVHEDSVVPIGGCGNASSSHDSSIQPNVTVDVNVVSGRASEPLIDATHGGVSSAVLAEFDTEVHVTGHDEVGESCVKATDAVQNGITTSLCDGDLCPVEEYEHHEVGDEAATLIPSVSATVEEWLFTWRKQLGMR
ncbi:hypothetical protein V6N11_009752 [Hibiscus sabdariffa]|uniref:Uncharacterized protein n=1 Tax=Hibiscus sabdariffa TaxID=183260 RepID=A0ABR2P6P1_9ROSI